MQALREGGLSERARRRAVELADDAEIRLSAPKAPLKGPGTVITAAFDAGHPAAFPKPGSVPRVARLMALAIRFEELVRMGQVELHADLARLGKVTRARIGQIMVLLSLAPDIQEKLLFLPGVERERDAGSEHELRKVCAVSDWRGQRWR